MEPITFLALNRNAIIVRRKKPFIDWANSLEDRGPELHLDDPQPERTVYLVDQRTAYLDPGPALRKHCRTIFEHELALWHLDPGDWPSKRDLSTFSEWFDVESIH